MSKLGVTYIDSAILNVTEWLCHRFQLLTGRTNVWLAFQLTNLSIIVYFVWAGLYFLSSRWTIRIGLMAFCSVLLYVLTQTVFKEPIEAYEASSYQRVAKGFRNPRRVRDALLRIPFLTLSLVLFYPMFFISLNFRVPIVSLGYSLVVLTTVVLYLLACDPLPPCAGKVREWIEGKSAAARLQTEQQSTADRSVRWFSVVSHRLSVGFKPTRTENRRLRTENCFSES